MSKCGQAVDQAGLVRFVSRSSWKRKSMLRPACSVRWPISVLVGLVYPIDGWSGALSSSPPVPAGMAF